MNIVSEPMNRTDALVLGTVQRIYLAELALDQGRVRQDLLRPVRRTAGNDCVRCSDRFSIDRPTSGR
ncbi:MAG TPA: hypothetical protein VD969_27155 [Symbiobacteriaceae bacterium]|nr:hypothetical protein [Symbiobacteriaceae bacterium]